MRLLSWLRFSQFGAGLAWAGIDMTRFGSRDGGHQDDIRMSVLEPDALPVLDDEQVIVFAARPDPPS